MRITADQAAARVRAGLGRPPQDALEATVVLEAFGGLGSRTALALAPGAVDGAAAPAEGVASRSAPGDVSTASTREVLGLVATLLATTAWVAPLAAALGGGPTDRAWKIALPVSFFLQWLLRRRHLDGPHGLGRVRADRPVLAVLALACLAVPALLLLDPVVALPAALVVTWVGGLLVVIRGWGLPYAASLLLATWALHLGVPVVVDIALVVALTGVALAAALLTSRPDRARPTPWPRSLATACIGGGTGLLIISDPAVEWSSGEPFPVVALVPSLLAGLWAGRHLNRIWTVLLDALASTRLTGRLDGPTWRVFAGIVLGALARLVAATAVLSLAAAALLADTPARQSELLYLLGGLGAFGLVNFLAVLLESFARVRSAALVVGAALAAAATVVLAPAGLLPAQLAPLPAAALAAGLAAVVPVVRLVRRPSRTLATLL